MPLTARATFWALSHYMVPAGEIAVPWGSVSGSTPQDIRLRLDSAPADTSAQSSLFIYRRTSADFVAQNQHQLAAILRDLLHRRLRHLGASRMAELRGMASGIPETIANGELECIDCKHGNIKRAPFPNTSDSRFRASRILERLHVDVVGPVEVPSLGGNRYVLF